MDIMELGAIGEFVSGIAVVASLLYVGLQVRQSNRLEKAESIRTVQRDIVQTLLHHDSALLPEAIRDFDGMGSDEKIRAHNWLIAFFSIARTEVVLSQENLGEMSIYPRGDGELRPITWARSLVEVRWTDVWSRVLPLCRTL